MSPDESELQRRVQRILLRPASEREAALDAESGGDAGLRADLARAVDEAERGVDRDTTRVDASIPPPSSAASRLSAVEEEVASPGEEIVDGSLRYVLVKRLPGGGLGEVWVADQVAPVRRRVAIKFIRTDKFTKANEARFENERRVLASFDHPNIARFYDAGRHRERPWFAMEFVEGLTIDQHCERNGLGVEERIRLVQQVARAVQYAHDREIVHRDIKPGNVLVTSEGVPKLLDFGIAKIVGTKIDGHRGITTDFEPHTEEYASPEQLRAQPSTTRSDVYALGVMLYELLTEQLPYHVKTRVRERVREIKLKEPPPPMSEALEAVSDEDPDAAVAGGPPSAGTAGTATGTGTSLTGQTGSRSRGRNLSKRLAEIARRRNTRPDRLIRRLRGDLDNIVAKAMRIEPLRRYASPESLAADLENHLQGLPVEARPESAAARLSRLLVRNRWAVAGALVSLVALVAVLSASFLWAQNRYLETRRKRLTDQREVLRMAWQDLGTLDAETAGALARSSGQLAKLRETLSGLERKSTSLCGVTDPGPDGVQDWTMLADLRRRLAMLADSAANRIVNAGDPVEAARWLEASDAAVLAAVDLAAASGVPADGALLIEAQNGRERGDIAFHRTGDPVAASRAYEAARGLLDRVLADTRPGDPAFASIRRERSTIKTKIADLAQSQAKDAADRDRVIAMRREVVDEYRLELEAADSPRGRVDLAIGLGRLADALEGRDGLTPEVLARFEEAVATVGPALNQDSQVETRKTAADAMLWLGNRLLRQARPGDFERAGQLVLDAAAQYLILTFRSPEESMARENLLRIQQGHVMTLAPALSLGILDAIRTARLAPDALVGRIGPTTPSSALSQFASPVTRAIVIGNGTRLATHWRSEIRVRRDQPLPEPVNDEERASRESDRAALARFAAEVAEAFLESIRVSREAIAADETDPKVRIEAVLCIAVARHPETEGLVGPFGLPEADAARVAEWRQALAAAEAARVLYMTGEAGEAWRLAKDEWSATEGARAAPR